MLLTRLLTAALLTSVLGGVYAAEPVPPTGIGPAGAYGANLTPAEYARAQELGRLIANQGLAILQDPTAAGTRQFAQDAQRRADDLADASLAQERARVLRLLGIDPDGESSLYYFVSWSMPLEILRSYALEAMWTGGTLVFRGIPPGKSLKDFILQDMQALVYGKGATAALAIDPRLFDVYGISVVPTLVLTTQRKNFECAGVSPRSFDYKGQKLSYDTCPAAPVNSYWKIAGGVTSDYALRAFADAGAPAAPYLRAMQKGLPPDGLVPQAQQPFRGEWKDAISPEELLAVRQAVEAVQQRNSETARPDAAAVQVLPGR